MSKYQGLTRHAANPILRPQDVPFECAAVFNSGAAMWHRYLAGRSLGLWITGTVAWSWVACTEWILGIRKTFDGLIVDPCIPAHWDGFTVHRLYRGCTYEISVENPEHVEHGVREVRVDGAVWSKPALPIRPGGTVNVRVVMGAPAAAITVKP